jgi:hypothetical protein
VASDQSTDEKHSLTILPIPFFIDRFSISYSLSFLPCLICSLTALLPED